MHVPVSLSICDYLQAPNIMWKTQTGMKLCWTLKVAVFE